MAYRENQKPVVITARLICITIDYLSLGLQQNQCRAPGPKTGVFTLRMRPTPLLVKHVLRLLILMTTHFLYA